MEAAIIIIIVVMVVSLALIIPPYLYARRLAYRLMERGDGAPGTGTMAERE